MVTKLYKYQLEKRLILHTLYLKEIKGKLKDEITFCPNPERVFYSFLEDIQTKFYSVKSGKEYLNEYQCPKNGWWCFKMLYQTGIGFSELDKMFPLNTNTDNRKTPKKFREFINKYHDLFEEKEIVLNLRRTNSRQTNLKKIKIFRLKRNKNTFYHLLGKFLELENFGRLILKSTNSHKRDITAWVFNFEMFINSEYCKSQTDKTMRDKLMKWVYEFDPIFNNIYKENQIYK